MRILLDTHVFIWMTAGLERLGGLNDYLEDSSNQLVLSAATSWEISIKHKLGKLKLPHQPSAWVPSRMDKHQIEGLPIEHIHALAVDDLPLLHKDPFDRLLLAQAKIEDLILATADPVFRAYTDRIISP